ncbi:MAG: hypothetical protein KC421_24400 [Anaerolineales bacterium]|nr:hypothetical protein [Anaerolineales bacterium]
MAEIIIDGELAKFSDLLKRVDKKSPSYEDIQALEEVMREAPELARLLGNLMAVVQSELIQKAVSPRSTQIAIAETLNQKRVEFAYDESPIWERLIIDNILNCWLRLQWVEHQLNNLIGKPNLRFVDIQHWENRLNASQRRFLRACETLARIRKMNLPPLQINIAQQQVNQVKQ